MTNEKLYEVFGGIDERHVKGAREPMKKVKKPIWVKWGAIAAVIALMVCSGTVGALAFSRETIVEIPAEQETVTLEEIGLTLIFPESWKGRYEVIEDTFEPYNSPMWEVCVKSVYDAKTPADESGEVLYRGTLFYVLQDADCSMSAEEFEETSGIAGIGRYLFATENATYAIMYASDVQFDPSDPSQTEEYLALSQSMKEIGIVMAEIMG